MNKLVTAAALASFLVSPAFAQSYDPDVGSGNVAPPPGYARTSVEHLRDGRGLYLSAPHAFTRADRRAMEVGSDPDPNIQFQLHRESQQGEW